MPTKLQAQTIVPSSLQGLSSLRLCTHHAIGGHLACLGTDAIQSSVAPLA